MDMECTSQPSMLGQTVLHRDAVPVDIGRKGVAGLVGDHLHIALGAVEVGEDEGHARSRGCWCSSRRRALPSVDSTSSSSLSSIMSKNSLRLGGELIVELHAPGPGSASGRAHRAGDCRSGIPARCRQSSWDTVLPSRLACSPVNAVRHRDEILLRPPERNCSTSSLV